MKKHCLRITFQQSNGTDNDRTVFSYKGVKTVEAAQKILARRNRHYIISAVYQKTSNQSIILV